MKVSEQNSDYQIVFDGLAMAFVVLFLVGFISGLIKLIGYLESLYNPI